MTASMQFPVSSWFRPQTAGLDSWAIGLALKPAGRSIPMPGCKRTVASSMPVSF